MRRNLITARLSSNATPERWQEWQEVFGSDSVPILSPLTISANLPRLGKRDCYLLDLSQIGPEVRRRLVLSIAQKFAIPELEVSAELESMGVPLVAEDLIVELDARALL